MYSQESMSWSQYVAAAVWTVEEVGCVNLVPVELWSPLSV